MTVDELFALLRSCGDFYDSSIWVEKPKTVPATGGIQGTWFSDQRHVVASMRCGDAGPTYVVADTVTGWYGKPDLGGLYLVGGPGITVVNGQRVELREGTRVLSANQFGTTRSV